MIDRPETLLTPGPVPVSPDVLLAQGSPMLYHRGPAFSELLQDIADGIRMLLRTEAPIVIHTASGTGGMESAVANSFSPGDKVLVVSVGNFGERFVKICRAYGLDVEVLEYAWGEEARADDVRKALARTPTCKGVLVTHSETSTGVVNDIESIAGVVRETEALLIVDTVSGAGACPFEMDAWGIDVAITGSQKAMAASPGAAFLAISDRALEAHRNASLPRFYFDWTQALEAFERHNHECPWTPAISVLMGVRVALDKIWKEGLERMIDRHRLLGMATRAGLTAMGMEIFASSPERSNVVTCVKAPEGLDTSKLVSRVREKFGLVIAGGQGKLKGKIFRIGHLGWVDRFDILRALAAVEAVLPELDVPVKHGVGVQAALEVFENADREFAGDSPV
ncbi:MAG: aminotransferase [Acidimicrobiia bacterium]